MKSATFTRLDLRLTLSRQPLLALLFGTIVTLSLWLLAHPSGIQPATLDAASDPARIVAAQRNFHSMLIPAADLAKAQQAILASAANHQLSVGHVEYAQEGEASAGFTRSTMHLPFSGRYADIRTFIESALDKQPALLIRHLSLQRETSAETNFALNATLTVEFLIGRP